MRRNRPLITPQQIVEYSVIVISIALASGAVMFMGEMAMRILG